MEDWVAINFEEVRMNKVTLVKNIIFGAALFVLPSTASAVPVDLDYDYTNFSCEGCYEYNIVNKTFAGRGSDSDSNYDLGAILYFYGDTGPRTRVVYDFEEESTLYLDVANSSIYITAGATSQFTNRGDDSPPGEFFNTDVQIYFQFVDGVTIETDADGIPVSLSVAGASSNNSGFFLWDDAYYAASLETKLNGDGQAASWNEDTDYFTNWMMGISSFLNTDETVNTELGNQFTVRGDFHFDTVGKEVPEPASMLLLASAIGGGLLRRKKIEA